MYVCTLIGQLSPPSSRHVSFSATPENAVAWFLGCVFDAPKVIHPAGGNIELIDERVEGGGMVEESLFDGRFAKRLIPFKN